MWSDLSVRHLLALRAVAEEGTFGRAASRLGFTQSAVSQQVAALEQVVGQTLFDRPSGPTPPRLTPAGELILRQAELVLGQIQEAEHELDRYVRGVSGRLAIGTFQSISARVLPFTLGRLRQEAPHVEVVLVEEDPEQDVRLGALARGDLDLAFVVGDVDPAFESQYLGADPHIAIVPPDFPDGPVDLEALAGQPMVGQPADDTCGLLVDRGLERIGLAPNYVFRSHDNGAVQGMVGAGVGIAIVPLLTVDVTDPAVSVRSTKPEIEPRRLSIVWSGDRTLAPVAERFVAIAADVCASQLATLQPHLAAR
ncbi:MAG: LysR family transcriptional regulator [Actinomycetota bacterium]